MRKKLILFLIIFYFLSIPIYASPAIDSTFPNSSYNDLETSVNIFGNGFDTSCKLYITPKKYNIEFTVDTGSANSVFVSNGYAYIADGEAGLQIIDLAGQNIIKTIGTPGNAYGVYVSGNYAYVADGEAGLVIIDIAGRNIVKTIDTPGTAYSVYVKDAVAFIADGNSGLQIIDLTNQNITGSVSTPGWAYSVTVSGMAAYIADGESGLQIIDITNKRIVGFVDTPGWANNICVLGSYAYIADGETGLQIINITAPSNPFIYKTIKTLTWAYSVYINDKYIYVGDETNIQIIDIDSLTLVDSINLASDVNNIYILNNYMYVANSDLGLQVINIVNSDIHRTINTPGTAYGVSISDSYAYVADGYAGLQIIDLINQNIAGSIDTPGFAYSVYVKDMTLYVAAGDSGLQIIDIVKQEIIGSINTLGTAYSVYVKDMTAYVAEGDAGLQIIDLTNRNIIASIDTLDFVNSVFVKDMTLYAAIGDSGLQIIDIPTRNIIGNIDTPGWAYDVYVTDNYAYIADGDKGLQIIDLANREIIGSVNTPGTAYSVGVSGSYAYIADGEAGLQIIDITNRKIINNIKTADFAYYIFVSGDYIYTACNEDGLKIFHKKSAGIKIEPINFINNNNITSFVPNGLMPDKYNLKLINSNGEESIYSNFTVLNSKAIFNTDTTFVYVPGRVNFFDSSRGINDTWKWYFGDGKTSNSKNTSHIYETAGIYSISLKIKGLGSYDSTEKKNYIRAVNPPILSAAQVNPSSGYINTRFIYYVTYSDENNTLPINEYPKININNSELLSMYPVDIYDSNYMDGKLYKFETTNFIKGGIYTYKFISSNTIGDTTLFYGPQVNNSFPSVSNLMLNPRAPNTTDNLVLAYEYQDLDNDEQSGTEIRWYKNNNLQNVYNNQLIIPGIATNKGDTWYFTTRPKDGEEFGESKKSNVVTIKNTAPVASNLTLNPGAPNTTDNLDALYQYQDLDNDEQSGTEIRWYKNDDLQSEYNNQLSIPSIATNKGETWYFTARPKDGEEFGENKKSNIVYIRNSAPQVKINFPKYGSVINQNSTINFQGTGIDSDKDTLKFTWKSDKDKEFGFDSSINYNLLSNGTHLITFVADDGEVTAFDTVRMRINMSPEVSISATPISGKAPQKVLFQASASDDGSITSYSWDFSGDNIYDRITDYNTTSYIYAQAGIYSASAQIKDNDEANSQAKITINIFENSPPYPNKISSFISDTTQIIISSDIANDSTPPIYYMLEGEFYNSSAWVKDKGVNNYEFSVVKPSNFIDDGLTKNGLYRYRQIVKDSVSPENYDTSTWYEISTLLSSPKDSDIILTALDTIRITVSVLPPPIPSGYGETKIYFDMIIGGNNDRLWDTGNVADYSNLLPNTQYGWKVKYKNFFEKETEYNSTTQTRYTLARTPNNLQAIDITDNNAELVWNKNGASFIKLERAYESSGPFIVLDSTIDTTLYQDTKLDAGTNYWYRISGYNGDRIPTPISNAINITTIPKSVFNFHHTNNSLNSITWEWDEVSGETGYELQDGDSNLLDRVGENINNIIEIGLSSNTSYKNRHIHAYNSAGYSDPSFYDKAYTSIEVSEAIFDSVTINNIKLKVNNLSNLSEGNSGVLFKNITNNAYSGWQRSNVWLNTNLLPNTQYEFQAQARNGDLDTTQYSSVIYKYTLTNIPANLVFINKSQTSIDISWDKNASTKYAVERANDGLSLNWERIAILDSSKFKDDGLIHGETYWYHIRGYNGDGIITEPGNDIKVKMNFSPIANNVRITPELPTTLNDLTGDYDYLDADGDPNSGTEIRWYKNSNLQSSYNNQLVIPGSATNKSEIWYFTVKPKDGFDYGELVVSNSVTIQNTKPLASNLRLSPNEPNTTDNLVGVYDFADTDGDPNSGTEIRWYKNSNLQSAYNNQLVIPGSATNKGEVWYFTIKPKDGDEFGEVSASNSVTIKNTTPVVSNLILNPSAPNTKDNLVGTYNYADVDNNEQEGTEIRWYKNNDLQVDYNNKLIVSASATNKGESWYFTVRPKDGDEFGENKNSNKIYIQNSTPQVKINFPKYGSVVNQNSTINFQGTGIDSDKDTLNFTWKSDKDKEFGFDSSINYNLLSNGTHLITFVADDGDNSIIDTTRIKINRMPNLPNNPNPANNAEAEPVNIKLRFNCSDPDMDTTYYSLYFDTTSPPVLVKEHILDTTFNITNLNYGQTYYWKIDAEDNFAAKTFGSIWKFKTYTHEQAGFKHLCSVMDKYETGSTLRLLERYETTNTFNNQVIKNTAFLYDNGIAILAFLGRGTDNDIARAGTLAQSMIFAQNNDRYFKDGRLRNGYRANNFIENETAQTFNQLDSTANEYQESTYTGPMAWTLLALLKYSKYDTACITGAKKIGNWIYENCYDTTGYTHGYRGYEPNQIKETYKLTEENIAVYSAFMNLYNATKDIEWAQRANHAEKFVQSMWNNTEGFFWASTNFQGIINVTNAQQTENAQSFAILALGKKYETAFKWAENNLLVSEDGYTGFDFNTGKDHIWFEETAHEALANKISARENKYDFYISQIEKAQEYAPFGNKEGIVSSLYNSTNASFDRIYQNAMHTGATAWYLLAKLNINPLLPEAIPQIQINITSNTEVITVGDTLQFIVTGGTSPYLWSVSDTTVAKINANTGVLTADFDVNSQTDKYCYVIVKDKYGYTAVSGVIIIHYNNEIPTAPSFNNFWLTNSEGEAVNYNPILSVNNSSFDKPKKNFIRYAFKIFSDKELTKCYDSGLNIAQGQNTTVWQVVKNLQENTRYWWTAWSYIGDIKSSPMNIEAFFVNKIQEAPTQIKISYPPDGSKVEALKAKLEVTNALDFDNDKVKYEFKLFNKNELVYETTVLQEGGNGVSECDISQLIDNTWYTWKARAIDEHGQLGAWMDDAAFFVNTANDAPTKPIISSPADGTELDTQTPLLIVNNSQDLDGDKITYFFEIDTTNTFNSPKKQNSNEIQSASWIPDNLDDNMYWYLRVKSFDGQTYSEWMNAEFFINTNNDAPGIPILLSPIETIVNTLTPMFQIQPSFDVDRDNIKYEYVLYDTTEYIVGTSNEQGTNWTAASLLYNNNKYFWQAQAIDEHGKKSGWSEKKWFKIKQGNNLPTAPIILSPGNGSNVETQTPDLEIINSSDLDGDKLTYHFQIFDNSQFLGNAIAEIDQIPEDTNGKTIWRVNINLSNNKTYYFRVRAHDGNSYSTWSETFNFIIKIGNEAGNGKKRKLCIITNNIPQKILQPKLVNYLNRFKDRYLIKNNISKNFVELYYKILLKATKDTTSRLAN